MMMTNLEPEVKSVDADHTFDDEAMKKNDYQLGGVAKIKNVYRHPHGSKKKVNGVMRGSADSLILQKSNARTMKMRKSDLWLAFCAHRIS